LLKYKYLRLHPTENVTLHVEKLTYPSRIKDIILRSLERKRLVLDSTRGPEIVARRIYSILQEMDLSGFNSVDWVLNVNSKESWERLKLNGQNLVVGPNIEFEKSHISERLRKIGSFKILAPSAWVIPIIQERLNWFGGEFHVLPSDLDFDYWKPVQNGSRNQILIYRKYDASEDDLINVVKICKMMGLTYKVVTYGKYTQRTFRRILRKCQAAVWLGTTESQGLALLECWSMDVPSLVRSQNTFVDNVTGKAFKSSPAPYLTEECGKEINASDLNIDSFSNFLNKTFDMGPRKYVISHLSTERILEKLLTILTNGDTR
jgi:hypothetical protein